VRPPLNSRAFSWTADSRLASLTASTGNESYTYSAFGTRAKVGTRTFLRAGASVTASVLADGDALYTPGVSEVRNSVTTYSHSGLKNMGAQTDAGTTPAVQATRTYDAFGGVQASTGSWQGPFGTAGAFGYQTEPSGLHLLGHRYYDATLGRFLTRDPIGDGSNWYAYCDNDPVAYADPDGEAFWFVLLAVAALLAADGCAPAPRRHSSPGAAVDRAIQKGPKAIRELLDIADESGGLSQGHTNALKNALQKLESTADDWISRNLKGSVNREFPSQMRNRTLDEIRRDARAGDEAAKKAWKLLNDSRFRK